MTDNIQYTREDAFVNSIIGEGTTLRGHFDLNGLLRIDGTFYGRVKTNGKVLVGKNGVAECEIVAATIVIGGKVKGDIFATERVCLLSTGELIGNIQTPRLVVEEGVIFQGKCQIIENKHTENIEKMKNEFLEKHQIQKEASESLKIEQYTEKTPDFHKSEKVPVDQAISNQLKTKIK